jgi:hypothetical protein
LSRGCGGVAAEYGWADHNAADDFSDDRSLSKLSREPAKGEAYEKNDGHLEKKQTQKTSCCCVSLGLVIARSMILALRVLLFPSRRSLRARCFKM